MRWCAAYPIHAWNHAGISDEDVQALLDATAVPVPKPPPPAPPSSDDDDVDVFDLAGDDAPASVQVAKDPLAPWIVQALGGAQGSQQPNRHKGVTGKIYGVQQGYTS